jgi:Xaa-Pro aminopeptidase
MTNEGTTNIAQLRGHIASRDLAAVLVTDITNVRWLTGFSGSFGMVIVTPDDGLLLTDSRYKIQAAEQVQVCRSEAFSRPTTGAQFLAQQLHALGIRKVGIDEDHVTLALLRGWQKEAVDVEFVAQSDACTDLRMIKSAAELSIIRQACDLADRCMQHVVDLVAVGRTERQLLTAIHQFLLEQGSAPSFEPIVVSGPRSARPHGTASDRALESGDFLTFDLGAVVDGYCSDITRTVVVGTATERHRHVYQHVLDAEEACISKCVAGAEGKELDRLTREILDRGDLSQYFTHGLGHGLGTLVHDSGRLGSTVDQTLEVGQVWTIEPGVYIEGFGGVRIEDDIVVTDGEPEVLTHFTKRLLEL